MLVDVFSKGITGKVAEAALGKAGITVNKNAIPFDQNPPMVASGIRVGTPAVTTRGMREAEMDIDRRADRPRAADARTTTARSAMVRDRSRAAVPEVPALSGRSRQRSSPPGGALARAMPDFEPRAGQVEMAPAVARRSTRAASLLAEAGTGTGKTLAYLVPAILQPRARARSPPAPRTCRNRSYFKDIPRCARRSAFRSPRTYMKGRANYLCLHQLDQPDTTAPAVGQPHDVFLPIIREWSARTETGDRAELAGSARRICAFWNEVVRDRGDLPRHRVPALRRLLRDAHAPARRRVRRRHRQPPSALRRRRGATERVRRGHPGLHHARSSTRRTSSRTSRRSISASASAPTGSRSWRATSSGSAWRRRPEARQRTRSRKRVERLRDHAPRVLHRARLRPSRRRPRQERRARARHRRRRSARRARRRRRLTGALDVVEATLRAAAVDSGRRRA